MFMLVIEVNLYYKEFSKYFGAAHGKEMITSLKDAVEQ